jgi:hypothetical protein
MKYAGSALLVSCLCSAALAAPPEILSVRPAISHQAWAERRPGVEPQAADARLYEKFELHVDLQATFRNPYDPDEVDLWAEFTAPSGRVYQIWGFYNPTGLAQRMVRFSPTEIGTWRYTVKVRDKEGEAQSEVAEFRCTPSEHHGFVRIAPNRRYLQYSDGTSFYGVGMWYNDGFEGYGGYGSGQITEEGLDRLRSLEMDFISFFPTPLETLGTGLGRYDPARLGRLDQLLEWCDERDMHLSWNLVFHSYISEAVWGGFNSQYRKNPYREITPAKDYFASQEAWRYQQKLNRYIIARWGYSRAVFLWFVVDEINGTEGWTEGSREAAEAWCRRMNDFFHEHDPYGRPTTGTQSGGIDQWWPAGYRIFDIAAREIYEAQGHSMPAGGKPDLIHDNPLRYSYRNFAAQTQALWQGFQKPAIIGECGWDHTYYEPGTPGYLATYHNALWAALANGTCATPFWWAYSPQINDSLLTSQVRAFSQFVRDIDFAQADWQPAQVDVTTGDAWAMMSDKLTFGWAANPMSGMARESLTIHGLPDGQYDVRIYLTWRGQYLDPVTVTASDGKLTVSIPELTPQEGHADNIGDDVAFKIVKHDAPR